MSGEPQFLPITGTTMSYATNTQNRVIQVGSEYYLCYQGIWFVATQSAGTVADGTDGAAGDLHDSAELSGVQRDVRDPGV